MRAAFDTNVLFYADAGDDASKQATAVDLIGRLRPEKTVLPVQVAGELFAALTRKGRWTRDKARDAVLKWGDTFPLIETSPEILLVAMSLAIQHQFKIWDAVILAAAADAGCRILLSEDYQDGFTWAGVTVVNPFAAVKNPLLASL